MHTCTKRYANIVSKLIMDNRHQRSWDSRHRAICNDYGGTTEPEILHLEKSGEFGKDMQVLGTCNSPFNMCFLQVGIILCHFLSIRILLSRVRPKGPKSFRSSQPCPVVWSNSTREILHVISWTLIDYWLILHYCINFCMVFPKKRRVIGVMSSRGEVALLDAGNKAPRRERSLSATWGRPNCLCPARIWKFMSKFSNAKEYFAS